MSQTWACCAGAAAAVGPGHQDVSSGCHGILSLCQGHPPDRGEDEDVKWVGMEGGKVGRRGVKWGPMWAQCTRGWRWRVGRGGWMGTAEGGRGGWEGGRGAARRVVLRREGALRSQSRLYLLPSRLPRDEPSLGVCPPPILGRRPRTDPAPAPRSGEGSPPQPAACLGCSPWSGHLGRGSDRARWRVRLSGCPWDQGWRGPAGPGRGSSRRPDRCARNRPASCPGPGPGPRPGCGARQSGEGWMRGRGWGEGRSPRSRPGGWSQPRVTRRASPGLWPRHRCAPPGRVRESQAEAHGSWLQTRSGSLGALGPGFGGPQTQTAPQRGPGWVLAEQPRMWRPPRPLGPTAGCSLPSPTSPRR